ncbi:cell wall-binding repeat-containing protein [Acidimicrobiia bacterium EGI L10123]|uniref:cell wall-binding repeat-containing protein n=1 Tax=Salinilacustrithrix flava TaxID=2957203 RepID=UPI003D7C1BD1|nr:cell wall-binding repeat-containing protein [Acidimicrobiia bacterium EGI L10123]
MRFKSRSRALAASALAASLGLAGLTLAASPAQAVEDTEIVRVSGATRYGTASAAAATGFPDGATNVVLASGEKFPDALAAGGLAGILDAPILLTPSENLDDETLAGLEALGAQNVTIMGGVDAVSDDVADALEGEGYTVERIAGDNRFETAADIAAEVGGTTAVLANGFSFADALAISPGAHELELPVLLTGADELSAEAAGYIDTASVDEVIIVGGTDVVSQEIEDALEGDGTAVTRLAGINRYETAIGIAEFHLANGFSADELVLATGEKFADALAGGPMASQLLAPMILTQTDTLTGVTGDFIEDVAPEADTIYILGGPAAVSDAVEDAAAAAAQSDATQVTVTPADDDTTITAGQSFAGTLTSDGGDITNVAVSGPCVTSDSDVDETDAAGGTDFDFAVHVDSDADEGSCTITFTVTVDGEDDPIVVTQVITVEAASTGGGGGTPPADTTPATVESASATDVAGVDDNVTVTFNEPVQGVGTYTVSDGTDSFDYEVVDGEDTDTLVLSPSAEGVDFDAHDEATYTLNVVDELDLAGNSTDATIPIAETGSNAEGVELGQTRVVSVDTGQAFATIQDAVDAEDVTDVDGVDTLEAFSADAGSFDELVMVSKDGLTISGDSAEGRADLIGTFVVSGADGVTIEGFDMSTFDTYLSYTTAFYLDDVTGLVLSDNVVTGAGADSEDKGVINALGGATEEASIGGSTFTALLQGVFANPSADFTIDSNSFEGNGVGSANDGASDITNNFFVDNTLEGVGLGIVGSTVTGNTFTGTAGNYVCDYTPDDYVLTTVAAANVYPEGYSIEEDGSAPDCITPAPGVGETRVLSVDTGRYFTSIQNAVDAEDTADDGGVDILEAFSAEGDSFDELVMVSKDGLTISGDSAEGRADLIGTFVVSGADGVTIEGFDMSTFDTYLSYTTAFYLDDVTGLVLSDNVVTGAGADSEDKGVINALGGATEEASIGGSTFTALLQGVFANPSADFTIDSNSFEGNGVGSANDGASDITNNFFVDNTLEGVGLGIVGSTVTGNTFTGTAGDYVCDYVESYDLEALEALNSFPTGTIVLDDNSSPDCITTGGDV